MKTPLEGLKPLMQCSVCGKAFKPARVTVLSEDRERTTLHLECDECGVASFVLVSSGQLGVASVGMLTDLSTRDARELFGKEPISTDQVIEVHRLLKKWKGNMSVFGG